MLGKEILIKRLKLENSRASTFLETPILLYHVTVVIVIFIDFPCQYTENVLYSESHFQLGPCLVAVTFATLGALGREAAKRRSGPNLTNTGHLYIQ